MTLTLYPAIDLKDGACVRLQRGEMDQATVYATDPGAQAARWQTVGFSWVHVVDLNGAFAGKPVNEDAVRAILASVSVPVQLGGGIRSIAQIETWLAAGITRVILGSAAAKNPELVFEAGKKFPGHIAVGIDAHQAVLRLHGGVGDEWHHVPGLDAPCGAVKGVREIAVAAHQRGRCAFQRTPGLLLQFGGRGITAAARLPAHVERGAALQRRPGVLGKHRHACHQRRRRGDRARRRSTDSARSSRSGHRPSNGRSRISADR
ncbi:MAG: hypothetical protein B7X08_07190 [Acidocella sp. 20-63-7]|nr:MAG: hypothetical protein B7X08_07190 [Acidocella sp. 20-63-7]